MATTKIIVGPNKPSTHDVSLNAMGRIYGLMLEGGPRGIAEGASVATSILANRQGARFGNNDPSFSHIEQRTWVGGRGQENISDDLSRFFDSQDCWTLSPNVLLPTLQWKYGKGLRKAYSALPGNVKWAPLVGATAYLARSFTTTATMSALELYHWLRKVGNPGNITAGVYADNTDSPNFASPVKTKTITAASITDVVSFFGEFLFASAGSLSTTTKYWLVVSCAGTPDGKNHWEVGYDATAAGKTSPDGTTWTANAALGIYYRLTEADVNQTYIPFVLDGVHYFATKRADQGTSQVFMVGDRGKVATASSTGLACTGKAWTASQWVGARVRICLGPGKGQSAAITSNTNDDLVWSPAFDIAPTSDSHFQIYQTDTLTEISVTTAGHIESVAVADDIAFFARGTEAADLKIMQFHYKSDGTHETDVDGSEKADLVAVGTEDGTPKLWRAENGPSATKTVTVSNASIPDFGDNLSFGSDIKCGERTWMITGMAEFNSAMYILKEDCVGYISNKKFIRMNGGLDRLAGITNGANPAVMDTYLYFPWSHSIERLAGGTMDDEGPWSGAGMPENRAGVCAWLEPIVSLMLSAYDAGLSGYSSLMAYNGLGAWTEILRGHNIGKRIRMTHWQANPLGYPYLWTEIGGDLVYQVFPQKNLNPLRDSGCTFMHEGVLSSSTIDLEVTALPKYFKDMTANTENLGSDGGYRRLAMEYQDDALVNTTTWIPVRECAYSPEETADLNLGNRRQLRTRIRLLSEIAASPTRVRAIVVSGAAKLPAKRVWTMRIKLSSLARDSLGAPNVDPTELYSWLWKQSREFGGVFMHTKWENADSVWVVVEPPGLVRSMVNVLQKWWGGVATVTLREA